jgi:hypothetical protein
MDALFKVGLHFVFISGIGVNNVPLFLHGLLVPVHAWGFAALSPLMAFFLPDGFT